MNMGSHQFSQVRAVCTSAYQGHQWYIHILPMASNFLISLILQLPTLWNQESNNSSSSTSLQEFEQSQCFYRDEPLCQDGCFLFQYTHTMEENLNNREFSLLGGAQNLIKLANEVKKEDCSLCVSTTFYIVQQDSPLMSSQEKQCILENFEIIGIQKVEGHSSEIEGFCLMK